MAATHVQIGLILPI